MRSAHALAAPAGFRSEEGQAGGEIESLEQKRARLRALRQVQFGAETLEGFVYRMQPLYCPVPNHLRPLYELIERSRHEQIRALVSLPPRHGKLVADSTPVLTPRGWRTHGDLEVGDEVFAPDGKAVKIIARKPDDWASLEVVFSDGAVIKAHPDHLWSVVDSGSAGRPTRVLETKEMVAIGLTNKNGQKPPRARFLVKYTAPIEGAPQRLPFEPYFLGLWLGDGTHTHATLHGAPRDTAIIRAELERRCHKIGAVWTHPTTGVESFTVLGRGEKGTGINGYFRGRKYVPPVFFAAPLEKRRDLLRGLVDSDGHVEPGGRVRFVNTNKQLIDDVERLVWTLGYRASVTSQAPALSSSGIQGTKIVYTVQWTPHDGERQAWLPRKDVRAYGVRRMRAIVAIREATPERGHCIAVDHPDRLYLVGREQVPTHNTETLRYALAWRTLYDPAVQNAYATYGMDLSKETGLAVRAIGRAAGVQIGRVTADTVKGAGSATVLDWKTSLGGGLKSTSLGGAITGRGVNGLLIVDDALKGSDVAASLGEKNRIWRWLRRDILSRLEGGGSCIIVQTRWAEDDPIGRMLNGGADWAAGLGEDWEYINLPAIGDGFGNPVDEREHPALARPLWSSINSRYPSNDNAAMDWYRVCRARDESGWWALYQGTPRSQGMKLFGNDPAMTWMPIEFKGRRAMLMLDPAAKGKESSDNSALGCFTMKGFGDATIWGVDRWGEKIEVINPNPSVMEVVEVWKDRLPVPMVVDEAYRWQRDKYPGLHLGVEVDGTGANLPDWIRRMEPKLVIAEVKTGGKDKYTRAQPASKAWRTDRILVPRADEQGRILGRDGQPYRTRDGGYVTWQCPPREYIRVMKAFTGMGDPEDDLVDITSASFNRMWRPWNESRQGTVRAPAY